MNQKASPHGSDQPLPHESEKFRSELMSAWIHISCSVCSGMTGSKQIKNENINRQSSLLSLRILCIFRRETTTKNLPIDPLAWLSVWIFEALQLCILKPDSEQRVWWSFHRLDAVKNVCLQATRSTNCLLIFSGQTLVFCWGQKRFEDGPSRSVFLSFPLFNLSLASNSCTRAERGWMWRGFKLW